MWFQNRRMKDKRQRMSMTWPFVAYDPAFASLLASSLPHMVYPPVPAANLPATAHLAPSATPYSAAAATAAYYRSTGYHVPGPITTLHRPYARTSPYQPPHLLHPSISPLHMLSMPNVSGSSTFPTVTNAPPHPPTTLPYRPTLLEELSPVNSDTSSECDCTTANPLTRLQSPPQHHSAQQPPHSHSHHSHRNLPAAVTTASLMPQRDRLTISSGEQSQPVRLNGMSVPIVTVLPFENNASTSYNHVAPSTSGISSSPPSSLNKPEEREQQQQPQQPQPKLFQPYKNDPPEDKADQNGTI